MKYINAHETKNELSHFFLCEKEEGESVTLEEIEQVIDRMESADVVEVVRCEDCKYWGVYDEPIKHCMKGMLKLPVHGYEFCCRGEKKE